MTEPKNRWTIHIENGEQSLHVECEGDNASEVWNPGMSRYLQLGLLALRRPITGEIIEPWEAPPSLPPTSRPMLPPSPTHSATSTPPPTPTQPPTSTPIPPHPPKNRQFPWKAFLVGIEIGLTLLVLVLLFQRSMPHIFPTVQPPATEKKK